MPNWCYNSLTVQAEAKWNKDPKIQEKEQKKAEKELLKFKKENFYGNTLTFKGSVPMPESLNITSGSSTDRAIAYLKAYAGDNTKLDNILGYPWFYTDGIIDKKDSLAVKRKKALKHMEKDLTNLNIEEGQKAIDNLEKYGHKDWYNWSIENWGTKWEPSEGGLSHCSPCELEAAFDTAWSPPIPWLQKVSEKYKNLKFALEYSEEGNGFEGKAFARDGELVDNCMDVNYPDTYWD